MGFRLRFFRRFNAFVIMKYLHHARDHFFPNHEIEPAARWLLGELGEAVDDDANTLELLHHYRKLDRSPNAP